MSRLVPLNFDPDLLAQIHDALQPNGDAWRALTVAQQVEKLYPFVRAQVARDVARGATNMELAA